LSAERWGEDCVADGGLELQFKIQTSCKLFRLLSLGGFARWNKFGLAFTEFGLA
jgi:hypothetical protein